MQKLTPKLTKEKLDSEKVCFIDVRSQDEFKSGHPQGAICIPLDQIEKNPDLVPKDQFVILSCQSGKRSNRALELQTGGFSNLAELDGGYLAWNAAGPSRKQTAQYNSSDAPGFAHRRNFDSYRFAFDHLCPSQFCIHAVMCRRRPCLCRCHWMVWNGPPFRKNAVESHLIIVAIAALLMGLSLGVFGAGGSILTVPILVYLQHIPPTLATHYSLFIVGTVSCFGVLLSFKSKQIKMNRSLAFALPALLGMVLTKKYFLPLIPLKFSIHSFEIQKDSFIMLLFALFMAAASLSMIFVKTKSSEPIQQPSIIATVLLILIGFLVGGHWICRCRRRFSHHSLSGILRALSDQRGHKHFSFHHHN